MMPKSRRFILILLLGLLAPLALGQATTSASRKAVSIKEMKFVPETIQVRVGEIVVWTNNDDSDHTVVAAGNGGFKSGNLRAGGSFSHKFTKTGSFPYACSYHPRMKGTVKVVE